MAEIHLIILMIVSMTRISIVSHLSPVNPCPNGESTRPLWYYHPSRLCYCKIHHQVIGHVTFILKTIILQQKNRYSPFHLGAEKSSVTATSLTLAKDRHLCFATARRANSTSWRRIARIQCQAAVMICVAPIALDISTTE